MASSVVLRVTQAAALSSIILASYAARAQTAPVPEPAATAPTATPPTPPPGPTGTEPGPTSTPPTTPPGEPPHHAHGHGEGHGDGHGDGHGEPHHKGTHHGEGHHAGAGPHEAGHEEHGAHHRRPFIGGFGYASVGMMTGGFSAMQSTLSQAASIGPGYDAAPTGIVFGGGGGALLNRIWVGGKGFGAYIDSVNTNRGTSTLTGAGGGGELGYAAVANGHWLVVPFFGVGGFGYTLKVQNATTTPLQAGTAQAIPVGGEAKYTASFLTGEIGLRISHLIFWGNAGLMVGAEVGYLSSLQRAAWTADSGNSPSESAELRGGYFRLLIGGGGFKFRDKADGGEHGPHD
jgi:hypothetical protein